VSCSAPECDRPIRYKTLKLCQKHYFRLRRNGNLSARVQRATREICIIRDCEKLDAGPHGLCDKHLARRNRNGDPHTLRGPRVLKGPDHPRWQGSNVEYGAVHCRLRSHRGSARSHSCEDCGQPAKQWSYNHDDPNELIQQSGVLQGLPYSSDVNHYSPRCVPCHKRFDLRRLGKAV
jgi:hypothetical protein